jgi:hypothetical protein
MAFECLEHLQFHDIKNTIKMTKQKEIDDNAKVLLSENRVTKEQTSSNSPLEAWRCLKVCQG